jgi:hypothetical protein
MTYVTACLRLLWQPAGRVVGIVKRQWKQYCGSIVSEGDEASVSVRATGRQEKGPVEFVPFVFLLLLPSAELIA